MAKRSSTRSTRADAPPSNLALIIALVFFIILSLGLGIMLYLAQEDITNAKTAQKKATDDGNAKDALAKQYEGLLYRLRSWIGDSGVQGEQLAFFKDQESRGGLPAWYDQLRRELQGDPNNRDAAARVGLLGEPLPDGKPKVTLRDKIKNAEKELEDTRRLFATEKAKLADDLAKLEQHRKEWNAETYTRRLAEASAQKDQDTRQKLEQKDAQIAALQAKIKDLERDTAKALSDLKTEFDTQRKQLAEAYEEKERERAEERRVEKEKARASQVVALDQPRGKIVRVDAAGETAYIDIGSDNRVYPRLTFSIYRPGPGGKANVEPIAKCEVVNVIGPRVSQVRITQLAKPPQARGGVDPGDDKYWLSDPREFWRVHNPVQPGDLIYNPLWDPNKRTRVALAGNFDLDGDGKDDLFALMRLLRDNNIDVDVYLDPADFQPRGRLDYKTDYLIIGGMPLLTELGDPNKVDPKKFGAGKLYEATANLQKEAAAKGVQTVNLNTFLARIGYVRNMLPTLRNENGMSNMKPRAAEGNGNKAMDEGEKKD